jgi:DNA-binding transcriptional MerR regulator/methanogenic corrinoid protein MtbC1
MDLAHSMAAVARRTRILPDTIRVWERRYKLVSPRREASGVRVYSDSDIARLELARDATRLGHPIRHIATMSNREIERLLRSSTPATRQELAGCDAVVVSAMALMSSFDFIAVQGVLTSAALSLPRDEFALNVLAPLLRRIGEEWSAGNLSVAQEHAASQIVRNLVGTLMLQAPPATGAAVVFATPTGEQHDFGIAIGALLASGYGLAVTLLGASVPVHELAETATRLGAQTVVIGSMANASDGTVRAFIKSLEAKLRDRVTIAVGGPAAAQLCEHVQTTKPLSTLEELASYLRVLADSTASRAR